MTGKRFTIHKENMYKEDWYDYPFCIKEDGEVVLETIPLFIAEKVRDKLNEQQTTINKLREILAEAEDMIEVRLAEHYIKEYENIKHHIIGDNDE